MYIREATADDVDAIKSEFSDALPHRWRPDGISLTAMIDDEVVGMALSCPNRVHPTRDLLFIYVRPPFRRRGIATALMERIRTRVRQPLSVKAYPGSGDHTFFTALGGVVYQTCPPLTIHTSRDDVQDWARRHKGETVPGSDLPFDAVLDCWMTDYEVCHAPWSPSVPREKLEEQLSGNVTEDADLTRSRFTLDADTIVAGCFVYPDAPIDVYGEKRGVGFEVTPASPLPDHPRARSGLAACIAHVLLEADGIDGTFDGHVTDPHFYPLLSTIPGVTGKALDLLELP